MKYLKLIFGILLLQYFFCSNLFSQVTKPVEEEVEVVLGIDKIKKLNFIADRKVQIGNDSILFAQLVPQKREIVFRGIKQGKTSVTVRNSFGDVKAVYVVRITANSQSKVVQELKEFLGDIEGLEIGVKGENVYVGGQIVVPKDIGKIVVILDKYQDVIRLVELSPHTQILIAKKMQEEIQSSGLKNVTVRVVNGLFWLEGIVSSNAEKSRAFNVAAAYLPDKLDSLAIQTGSVKNVRRNPILNFININAKEKPKPAPKMVKITAQFVEMTKDYNRVFGFKWQPLMAGTGGEISFGKTVNGGVVSKSNNTLSATISNLFPKLASAKSAGSARVIQSGIVVVKNSQKGTISKTSSKNFSIGSGQFTKSEKATSGFSLNVTPKVMAKENVDLSIGINVSSTLGDPPEVLSNKIDTKIVVKSKESAVIGGVVVNKTGTDYDRDPPYGVDSFENGSPLFSFLRSKKYTNSKNQFVIFITPEIIESASTGVDEIRRKFRKRSR